MYKHRYNYPKEYGGQKMVISRRIGREKKKHNTKRRYQ